MVENTCVQGGVCGKVRLVSTVWVNQLPVVASFCFVACRKMGKCFLQFLQFRDCRIHKSTGIDMYDMYL